jgi:hypothetical protein
VKSDNIKHHVWGKAKNTSQKLGLYERKAELQQKIEEFNEQSLHFLNLDTDMEAVVSTEEDGDDGLDDEDSMMIHMEDDVADVQDQAVINLLLPSNISNQTNPSAVEARSIEMDLRKGQTYGNPH